jgi:hypothetical protein
MNYCFYLMNWSAKRILKRILKTNLKILKTDTYLMNLKNLTIYKSLNYCLEQYMYS